MKIDSITKKSWVLTNVIFLIALVLTVICCSLIGYADIDIKGILSRQMTDFDNVIIFKIRLPRVLMAGLAGAGLSLAGVIFQALLRNPLADPYILGISGGCAFGAVLAIVLGIDTSIGGGLLASLNLTFIGISIRTLFAFLGGIITMLIVYSISRIRSNIHLTVMLLAGVMINAFFGAIIVFLMTIVNEAQFYNIYYWLIGWIEPKDYITIFTTGMIIITISLIFVFSAKELNAISVGEEIAIQLGVNVKRAKKKAFILASLLTAAIVSQTGIIGFVGLMIPHAVRLIVGSDHRVMIPSSIFCGAIFLILADTFTRTVFPATGSGAIPVGIVTAFLGVPFFIWLLKKRTSEIFSK